MHAQIYISICFSNLLQVILGEIHPLSRWFGSGSETNSGFSHQTSTEPFKNYRFLTVRVGVSEHHLAEEIS